ncbi:unnamed protein product [Prunus armeniaca]
MLAFDTSVDQVDEITRMGKSTILESLVRFCDAIKTLYTRDYLRKPMHRDFQKLLQKAEARGFPSMIESIDCMHWQWKNAQLLAVASFDTWVRHVFFGVVGSQNDLNVLGQSPVFKDVLRGQASQITYEINNTIYWNRHYLADGINLRWTTFVKTILHP